MHYLPLDLTHENPSTTVRHRKEILAAVLLSLLTVGYYLWKSYLVNSHADIKTALTLIGASAGVVSSLRLGYYSIALDDQFMGDMANWRIPIFAGAFSLLWVTLSTAYNILIAQ